MSLALGQMTYNGANIGPGGIAQLAGVTGLTALPANRMGDVSRPNAHGMLGGYDFMGTRSVVMNLEVTAGGGNTMPVNLELLAEAMLMKTVAAGGVVPADSSQILTYNFGQSMGGAGVNRRVCGRVRKFDAPIDIAFAADAYQHGVAHVSVLMECIDPLIYDAVVQSASVGLSQTSGGLTFPVTPPFLFGSQTGGLIFAANSGGIAGPAYMTIAGPCQNPLIQQQTTGVTIQFNTTLNTGDQLVIDTWAGSAVLNGTASRVNTLAPGSFIEPFTIAPGSNNIAFFSSDSGPTGATLTLNWSNTWAS